MSASQRLPRKGGVSGLPSPDWSAISATRVSVSAASCTFPVLSCARPREWSANVSHCGGFSACGESKSFRTVVLTPRQITSGCSQLRSMCTGQHVEHYQAGLLCQGAGLVQGGRRLVPARLSQPRLTDKKSEIGHGLEALVGETPPAGRFRELCRL